jgi:glycosyltransferase involved in cell wall biosynthesis
VKVLCFIDSLASGGAETSLAALAPEYARRGVELEVAYLKERPGLHDRFEDAGARLFSLADEGGRASWARAARRLISERRPDLVHTTLFEADIAGRIGAWSARIPVVSSLVNVEYGPEQFADPRLSAWRLRGAQAVDLLTARTVVRWHAITEHVARVMAPRLRISRDRIDVIPRGRDPKVLGVRTEERRRHARLALGIARNEKLIVAAARQEHQKGLDLLLDSMPEVLRRVPATRLIIAGRDGNQTAQLKDAQQRLGLNGHVNFLGPRADVPDLLCAADAFAFPSRFEGLGSVLIEAMALEAPIVATEIPAVSETLHPGIHATLVPSERPQALATALVDVFTHPDVARRRATAARRRFIDRYTIDAVANGMVEFYQRALRVRSGDREQREASIG